MEKNLNRPFVNWKGEELASTNMADEVCKILYNVGSNGNVSPDEKWMAYKLCNRIMKTPERVGLSSEETVFVLKLCAESLLAGAYGQIKEMLEG